MHHHSVDGDVSCVPDAVMNVIFDRLSPHEIRRIERKYRKIRSFSNDLIWKKKCYEHLRPEEMNAAGVGGEHQTWRSLFSSVRKLRHRTEAKWLEEARMLSSQSKKRRSHVRIVPVDEEKRRITIFVDDGDDKGRKSGAADGLEESEESEELKNSRKKRKQTEDERLSFERDQTIWEDRSKNEGIHHHHHESDDDIMKSADGRVFRTHTYRVGKTLYSEVSVGRKEKECEYLKHKSPKERQEEEEEQEQEEVEEHNENVKHDDSSDANENPEEELLHDAADDDDLDAGETYEEDAMICCAFDEFDEDYHERYFDYGE
eukprot:TRINITY_DN1315_c0_g1_i1.p1 TRINITY_DN1315_c0_g1~~TRINITY_DN1315_c0_g1_i1.p1  ORF type:complete len:317 (-),score=134.23 TRINITY_DN1315_c0_g1_i1:478-1428(-)